MHVTFSRVTVYKPKQVRSKTQEMSEKFKTMGFNLECIYILYVLCSQCIRVLYKGTVNTSLSVTFYECNM